VDLENSRVPVRNTILGNHGDGNHGGSTSGRGSAEGINVDSEVVPTPSMQNQIKASSDMNVSSRGCDLRDKLLQPVKQPVGCTR